MFYIPSIRQYSHSDCRNVLQLLYLCTHPTVYTWYLPLYGYYFQVPGTPLLFCCLGQRYVPCIILKVYGNSVGIGHLDLRKRQLKMIVRSLEDKSAGTKKKQIREVFPCFSNPSLKSGSTRRSIMWRPRVFTGGAVGTSARTQEGCDVMPRCAQTADSVFCKACCIAYSSMG